MNEGGLLSASDDRRGVSDEVRQLIGNVLLFTRAIPIDCRWLGDDRPAMFEAVVGQAGMHDV